MSQTAVEPTKDFKLSKSVIKWVAVGLLLSSSVVIIITIYSDVTLSDLASIGYLTFGLAAAASVARLLVQIVRFRVITAGLTGDTKMNMSGLPIMRLSSEFISISTPSSNTGVLLRTAWLSGKGVGGGTALWIGYFEVLINIYVDAGLALLAAGYAFFRGAVVLGSTIALIAVILIAGYSVIFIIPLVKVIKVPHSIYRIAAFLVGGPRATTIYLRAVVGSLNFSLAARAILKRDNLPLLLKTLALTFIEDLCDGVALWLVLNAAGLKIDLFSTTIISYGVITLSQIPITIGGAGLMELTMQAYLTAVYGFSSWAAIVLWRVTTYQVVLATTGVAFLLFVRRATKHTEQVPGVEQHKNST